MIPKARFVLLVLTALLIATAAQAQEFRGAWVTAWAPGYFTPQQCDATVAAAKSVGIDALFIQVRKNADAYYESALEPRAADIAPGFDPLAYIVDKAHKQGIQIHAWINTYRVWTAKDRPTDPTHVVNAHPEWLNKSSDGQSRASEGLYIDPGVPQAREHIAEVVTDIAKRYDIDGIHLDYIRYPGSAWGYSGAALSRYYAETGASGKPAPTDAKWLQWRRDQVTRLVSMISRQVRAVKPNILLSAATIPWGDCPADYRSSSPYAVVCQDWKQWLVDGLLDANVPMNYKTESSARAAKQFRNWLDGFKRWDGGRKVYVGIDVNSNDLTGIRQQMEAVRKAGLGGVVWFSFNATQRRAQLVKALGNGIREPVVAESGDSAARDEFDLGIRHATANQLGTAIVHLKKAIDLDPEFAEAYFRLGRCYLRERNSAKAEEFFKKTLELDPSHEGAKNELQALQGEPSS